MLATTDRRGLPCHGLVRAPKARSRNPNGEERRIPRPCAQTETRPQTSQVSVQAALPRPVWLILEGPVSVTANPEDSSDETLMIRYQRGDRTAFGILVKRYERPLYTFASRYLGRSELARDVTQESFLRVVKRSQEFRHEARFSTWIFAIVRNLCIDEIRKSKHRKHLSLDENRDGAPNLSETTASNDTQGDPEKQTLGLELGRELKEALGALPEDQLEVFLLRELAGLPFAEIAEISGVSENTIKSRMRYALEKLQKALIGHEEQAKALR